MKYLKYYISLLPLKRHLYLFHRGILFYPLFHWFFFIYHSRRYILKKDASEETYSYVFLLDSNVYQSTIIDVISIISRFALSSDPSDLFQSIFMNFFNIDLFNMRQSMNVADSISLVALTGLL
ncbi:hypothetical protein Ct9H90mP29_14860 [bacterium]|nr:MAG: hypothetical protein Ct9H90mP29_14860 [bacterium]